MPSHVDGSVVEQRILEQGSRIRGYGAVTAWAALRWRGARFFEGETFPDGLPLPVPIVTGGLLLRPDPRVSVSRAQLAPDERELIGELWCALPDRALFDEIVRHGQLRQGVVDIEMVVAAGLLSVEQFRAYVGTRSAWTGVPLVREALALAGLGCVSPQETRMVLVWMLEAGLPRPLCNQPVFGLRGNLIGIPDLLDVEAGLVGEYGGADHRDAERHRKDIAREERFRNVGLETFEVVEGDLAQRDLVARRMLAARSRAQFLPPGRRQWTLDQPAWWRSRAS